VIETPAARARVGYPRPGWTPREAIRNGLMVIVNGARLINQRNTQHYLFTQVYSLIMSEMNRRQPADPNDKPVALVMDEVYSLISIPGMAEEVGMLAPLYRSRKLELYIVLQSLSQLALTLRQQIWSIGNIVSFAVSNFEEAYELSQQIFSYDSKTIRLTAKTDTGQPIVETDRGQYLKIANDIQRMKHRECIIRRYQSEKLLDKYVLWVKQTKDTPQIPLASVYELKETLLKERAVRVSDALDVINQRKLATTPKQAPKPPAL
jgi:type IV secretory pathway TraG/TraD family ATPase VirD4